MLKNKFISLILIFFVLSPSVSFAEELDLDLRITVLEKGDTAPFSGLLLTSDSINKMKFDHDLELRLKENELYFLEQKFQFESSTKDQLWSSEREMLTERLKLKEEYIEKLQETALGRSDWTPVYILGGFLIGCLTTVGIAYAIEGAR